MSDKEFLEMAAKAAGIDIFWLKKYTNEGVKFESHIMDGEAWKEPWNPLTDDGDALRLAVKLGIGVWQYMTNEEVGAEPYDTGDEVCEWYGTDPYAATRRAIVRAAAEIGRQML